MRITEAQRVVGTERGYRLLLVRQAKAPGYRCTEIGPAKPAKAFVRNIRAAVHFASCRIVQQLFASVREGCTSETVRVSIRKA